jgi:hypothetical protein
VVHDAPRRGPDSGAPWISAEAFYTHLITMAVLLSGERVGYRGGCLDVQLLYRTATIQAPVLNSQAYIL